MAGMLRIPRTRGVLSGILLVLFGLWGGLIPLVGPYFDFGFTPDRAWHLTSGRVLLEIVPSAAVVLGGLVVAFGANRAFAAIGAWLAALGGGWLIVGIPVSAAWAPSGPQIGHPLGGLTRRIVENVTFFSGLGAVIVFFAALALGRFAVVGVREARIAEDAAPVTAKDAPAWEGDPAPADAAGKHAFTPVEREATTTAPGDRKVAGERDGS